VTFQVFRVPASNPDKFIGSFEKNFSLFFKNHFYAGSGDCIRESEAI
jgi:hypothetical protein